MKKIKLFCLPYAGGSASVYYKWKKYLHPQIDLYPLELAGRDRRFVEPLYASWNDALEDVSGFVKERLDDSPVALFGYSMGSVLAFELAHQIKEWTGQDPQHLFVAARAAPHNPQIRKLIHHLPDQKFLEEIIKIGGISEKIVESKELLHMFIPILRADFKMIESYEYCAKETKLYCDISVLDGVADDISNEGLTAWKVHTHGQTSVYKFIGGHFFIHNNINPIVDLINQTLFQSNISYIQQKGV
ncbi:thioesterase II family protein [Bacillus cereus]|uniref:thioesterase II family protein n=1 Tax=Bacillus cereus TaxID=1396 RepID=UPI0018793323|nr:thioesterase [Bacillus cereus]MBE7122183.1 thioesterase [Bacillus cereus]